MKIICRSILQVLVLTTILTATALGNPVANAKNPNSFNWRNIASDMLGVGRHTDANLVNPWGIAPSGTSLWVADNGTGLATAYSADGTPSSTVITVAKSATNPGT